MSDDPFAELEKQLAEIATYGSKKTTPSASARSSIRVDNNLLSPNTTTNRLSPSHLSPPTASPSAPQSNQQVQQLQSQLSQTQQQVTQLQQELEQWKTSSKEANQRALTLNKKLHDFAEAVKEERSLQKISEDELEQRAEAAEARAVALEEKLIKLVEIVKKDRASRTMDSPNANQSQLIEVTRKNIELQQEIQVLSEQLGALEGELMNQETMRKQDKETIEQLQDQLEKLNQQLSLSEHNAEQVKTSLSQKVENLEKQIQDLQRERQQLSQTISQEREQTTLRASASGSLDAEERAEKAEALNRDYEAKIAKLVAAVKSERAVLKEKMESALAKAQEESERAAALERQLLERPAMTTSVVEDVPPPPFDDGPAPPPPPPPTFKVIDPSKIVVKKGEGVANEEKPRDAKAENMANLINEIKTGVKLKSVGARPTKTSAATKNEGVDLGALASEIAKNRQKRIVNKPANTAAPRKSVALTNLLKELDGL